MNLEEKKGPQEMHLSIVSWNIAGAKHLLESDEEERKRKIDEYREQLKVVCQRCEPHVVFLQEDVCYKKEKTEREWLTPDCFNVEGAENGNKWIYKTDRCVIIDTEKHNHPERWVKYREKGKWELRDYLAQGSTTLWRNDVCPVSVWDRTKNGSVLIHEENKSDSNNKRVSEVVAIDNGIYTGFRDTEPRAAFVHHFSLQGHSFYTINVHFTTLKGEREGYPEIEERGDAIRVGQAKVILNGIVSRCNEWRARNDLTVAPWIIGGDLNATPSSQVINEFTKRRFLNISRVSTQQGTKRKGGEEAPELTLDYIFIGVEYHAFTRIDYSRDVQDHGTLLTGPGHDCASDHFPIASEVTVSLR